MVDTQVHPFAFASRGGGQGHCRLTCQILSTQGMLFCPRSTPCPSVKHGDEWGEPSRCDGGDSCQYCHSRTEQQFHPEVGIGQCQTGLLAAQEGLAVCGILTGRACRTQKRHML